MNESLRTLSQLLKLRYNVDRRISHLIGRPVEKGHIGAYIASTIFDIELNNKYSAKGGDGYFRSGPLAGKSVEVKFLIGDALVDLKLNPDFDFYLVLKGPASEAKNSRVPRSLAIETVYLFDARKLDRQQMLRNAGRGTAASITKQQRDEARIYPPTANAPMALSAEQLQMLALFSAEALKGVE